MADSDAIILTELRALRGELTAVNTRLSSLEGSLSARPCLMHTREWTVMRTDVALLKQGVKVQVAKIASLSSIISAILALLGGWLVTRFNIGGP